MNESQKKTVYVYVLGACVKKRKEINYDVRNNKLFDLVTLVLIEITIKACFTSTNKL